MRTHYFAYCYYRLSVKLILLTLCCFTVTTMCIADDGLELSETGTSKVYFSYQNKPLLSFGAFSDFIFYASEDAFDYKRWANWAADHGMNHARAYLPGSWSHIESFTQQNGGSVKNVLFPYMETFPGSRQFDLTRFNPAYWKRFREQCEYLQNKGIIIDLLMLNGWQFYSYNLKVRKFNWGGHFFNPANNINKFTHHLGGSDHNRLKFYHSFADEHDELFQAQKKYFEKIVDVTHDLDNIYYDLVHELGTNYEDWTKTSLWIDAIAKAVRFKWTELEPNRQIILSIDAGQLKGFPFNQAGGLPEPGSEVDWIFTRPYFDVLIWGNVHHVANAREWPQYYKKPYIPQESFDDIVQKWTYIDPEMRIHTRKYLWKMMMAKAQQIDLYMKPLKSHHVTKTKLPHNYDPRGHNAIEEDALKIREFWNLIKDYPNLKFKGHIYAGPVGHHLVLSSDKEAVIYLSSPTGIQDTKYPPYGIRMRELNLKDGKYDALLFDPANGKRDRKQILVKDGKTKIRLPAYVDDIAVHMTRKAG